MTIQRQKQNNSALWLVLGGAFVLRMILAGVTEGYPYDMSCFVAWGEKLLADGPAGFYSGGYFADYPPGYLWVLGLVGAVRAALHIAYESKWTYFLLALVPSLCDCGLAWLVYRAAKRRSRGVKEHTALVLTAFTAFNPLMLFDTGVWKQIDGAFALPLVFYAFLVARGPRHTVFYGIPAFLGGLALAVVDAEGLMLGVGVAALVLICQKNFTTRTLRRLAVIGAFFFFHAGWMQYMRTHVYTQGGKPMLAALGHVAQRGFVVCLVVWAALYFGLRGRELPLYRPGRVLAGGIVAGAVLLTLLANCVPGFPSLGRLDDVLIFNDNWGTYRGTAWRITVESWLAQPVWRKLLGVGPGMMHTAVADWAGAGITDRMKTFYAAHNEYLELLLTTGAAGLAAWLWFVIAHLRRAAQNWLRPGVAPVTLALISYLAHAVISIRVSMIFPEIMLLFALLQVFCLPEKGDAAAEKAPAKHGKKAKPDVPANHHGLARQWLPPILAAVVMMAVCGAASRVIFGFLY